MYCPVNRYKCDCPDQPQFTPKRMRKNIANLHGKYAFLLIKHKHMVTQHNYEVIWCSKVGFIYTCNTVEEEVKHFELKHNLVKESSKNLTKELGKICPHCNIDWEAEHKSKYRSDINIAFQRHLRNCQVTSFNCDCPAILLVKKALTGTLALNQKNY